MNTISKLLFAKVTTDEGDIRFARRGSQVGAVVIVAVLSWAAWRHSTNALDMIVAGGLGVLTAALLVAMANLTATLSQRLKTQTPPARWPEYAGYAITVVTLSTGFWLLSQASLDRIGFLTWMLALLASGLALVCLSKLSTLVRMKKVGVPASAGSA